MKNIKFTEIESMPIDCDSSLALSFGYVLDNSILLECVLIEKDLYLSEILFSKDTDLVIEKLKAENKTIITDSADPKFIHDMRLEGVDISPSRKYRGMIAKTLSELKKYNIYVTKDSPNLIEALGSPLTDSPIMEALINWCTINLK